VNDDLRTRAREQFIKPERFDRTQFLAAVSTHKMNFNSGTMDVTFSVGPGEQDHAWKVSKAIGELLLVTVERVSMKGEANASVRKKPVVKEAVADRRRDHRARRKPSVD